MSNPNPNPWVFNPEPMKIYIFYMSYVSYLQFLSGLHWVAAHPSHPNKIWTFYVKPQPRAFSSNRNLQVFNLQRNHV